MKSNLKMLALGDSYTIGELVKPEERWTHQLIEMLKLKHIYFSEPQTIATTGWTTDELHAAINRGRPPHDFDLVSLLIGVNNQYRGRTLENYKHEFETLLEEAITFASNRPSRVIVLSIPDWGVTPFCLEHGGNPEKVATEIDAFNLINLEGSNTHGVHYVDITPISRNPDPSLLVSDLLHPSGVQYKLWAEATLPLLINQF